MSGIFLCYRSEEDGFAAALLDAQLSNMFGKDEIFRASRSTRYRYSDDIKAALATSQIVVVLIGKNWINARDEAGTRLIDRETDWVAHEIEIALNSNAKVFSVLLGHQHKLIEADLPDRIKDLAAHRYLRFDHRDVEGSAKTIADYMTAKLGYVPPSRPVTEWKSGRVDPDGNLVTATLTHEKVAKRDHVDLILRSKGGGIRGRLTGYVDEDDWPLVVDALGSLAK